jgi:7-cyano-7-deazaguanine synthase
VAYGAHTGDHTIYPDCRPEFVESLSRALGLADWHRVELFCPFLMHSKADIVARGAALGVDFAATWSCYEGGEVHCGRCGTCVERREAFKLAGVDDPTRYA